MKVVILAGGLGTRISEETSLKPKPMVEIGGMPILWHILKMYSHYGINDFIVCCGYKGYVIKEFFANYFLHMSDVTFDVKNNEMLVHKKHAEDWRVTLVDTGLNTMTGGRLKRVQEYLSGEESFCMAYGDCLSDVNVPELIKHHNKVGAYATLTATFPPGRFGALETSKDKVLAFKEKPRGDGSMINGGFFVLRSEVMDYIVDDTTTWEQEPLEALASDSQLGVYKHTGFWKPMDTLRDKINLEELWESGKAPWKVW